MTIDTLDPPANDNFVNAMVDQGLYSHLTLAGSTVEPADGVTPPITGSGWFKLVAPFAGQIDGGTVFQEDRVGTQEISRQALFTGPAGATPGTVSLHNKCTEWSRISTAAFGMTGK